MMTSRIFALIPSAAVLLATLAAAQTRQPEEKPRPAMQESEEMLAVWNDMARKLITMAEDFPEEKYWYAPTKEVRSFGAILLHVAAANYFFINPVAGREVGQAVDDPPADQFKTKASVVAFLKKSFADGAAVLKAQGEAGFGRPVKHPFANQMIHPHSLWMEGVIHAGEHYGNLVTYYRLNGIVPPESRPRR